MSKELFGSTEDDSNVELTINKGYANRYDSWRGKEELQKLKDRLNEESDSDEEAEDDIAQELTPEVEKNFYKALASIKSHDPDIYRSDVKYFDKTPKEDPVKMQPGTKSQMSSKKKEIKSALTLRDYERKVALEKQGVLSDDNDSGGDDEDFITRIKGDAASGSYAAEQKKIKDSLKKAISDVPASDEETNAEGLEDSLFIKREKTKQEKEKEDEYYIQWLKGQEVDIDNADGKQMKSLRDYWNSPNLEDDEKFLRDYILNHRYREENEDEHIPTYEEIVALDEDEAENDRAEQFERKYNFRFEDPDQEFIKTYPRAFDDSMRRPDDKRKEIRETHKQRKLEEKERMQQELRQMKNMVRKEILAKVDKLKTVTGDSSLAITAEDLEKDFDPSEYDRKMQEVFAQDNYYHEDADDEEKPEFSSDSEPDECYDAWEVGSLDTAPSDEDVPKTEQKEDGDERKMDETGAPKQAGVQQKNKPDECYDAWEVGSLDTASSDDDVPKTEQKEDGDERKMDETGAGLQLKNKRAKIEEAVMETMSKKKQRRSKRTEFLEAVKKKKPRFDPNEKTFEEYFEDYYKLTYEDIVGNQPCRFHYRNVQANDFGLTADEILDAKDKELNQWVSIKKMSQYREEHEERQDVDRYRMKAQRNKFNILPSLKKPQAKERRESVPEPEPKKSKHLDTPEEEDNVNAPGPSTANDKITTDTEKAPKKAKKRRKKSKTSQGESVLSGEDEETRLDPQSSFNDFLEEQRTSGRKRSGKKQRKRLLKNASTSGLVGPKPSLGAVKSAPRKRTKGATQRTNQPTQSTDPKRAPESDPDKRAQGGNTSAANDSGEPKRKSKKQRAKVKAQEQERAKATSFIAKLPDERLAAYGLNPKKVKAKAKYAV